MNFYKKDLLNNAFSHLYIENEIKNHPMLTKILSTFSDAKCITINHYKDVFCRAKQDYLLQKNCPKLILAKKDRNLIYEGAAVCQNFGNKHFYYTSCVMNCIYDCEYCYLQGMYSSANLVVFINLEDIFEEVKKLLEIHPVYLCISYDTDLLALEGILGYVREWIAFAKCHLELTIEIRTKSANFHAIKDIAPSPNVILAWTLSPDIITNNFEHNTPPLQSRLKAITEAMTNGYQVRLCFDPMLYVYDFYAIYKEFISEVFSVINYEQLFDVSIGVFRVSNDYLKRMRKQRLFSSIVQYPYEQTNGVSHYGNEKTKEMITFMKELISLYLPMERIYEWTDSQ